MFLPSLDPGNVTSYNTTAPSNCTDTADLEISLNLLPKDALKQILPSKATKGTLLGAFRCFGTAGLKPPNITVSRTSTLLTSDSGDDIVTYDIITDQSNSYIHYWVLDAAQFVCNQYFLISCTDELSVFSEHVSIAVDAAPQLAQPSFISVRQQYTVNVHGMVEDIPIFAIEVGSYY